MSYLITLFQGSSWTLQAEQMDGDLVRFISIIATKLFYFIFSSYSVLSRRN